MSDTKHIYNLIFEDKEEDDKQTYILRHIAFALAYKDFLNQSKSDDLGTHDASLIEFCKFKKNDFEEYKLKARVLFEKHAIEYVSEVYGNAFEDEDNKKIEPKYSYNWSLIVAIIGAILGAISTLIAGFLSNGSYWFN